jgi:hypothetical protein
MMTPEDQRKKKNQDPTAAMRERRERHDVARPESEAEFLSLDFASRCAVAGLQLGRTKVFLRREAFDRIEAMRSDKFFSAAATIQKNLSTDAGLRHRHPELGPNEVVIIPSCGSSCNDSRRQDSVRLETLRCTVVCF